MSDTKQRVVHPIPVNTLHPERQELLAEDLFYGGYCPKCQCFHSLDPTAAFPEAKRLLQDLLQEQRLDYELPSTQHKDSLKTDGLFDDYGKMFGVLIAQAPSGEIHQLKAFSYAYGDEWVCDGWAPPLFDYQSYLQIGEKGNSLIYPLTDQIKRLPLNTLKRNVLVKQRREVSQQLMQEYLDLYQFHREDGTQQNIRQLYYLKKQLPMGTGDCCAPKLLNEAGRRGWTPLSIAEFYFGNPGKDGQRLSGQFYSSCEGKCHPILGQMLCGNPHSVSIPADEITKFYPSEQGN